MVQRGDTLLSFAKYWQIVKVKVKHVLLFTSIVIGLIGGQVRAHPVVFESANRLYSVWRLTAEHVAYFCVQWN